MRASLLIAALSLSACTASAGDPISVGAGPDGGAGMPTEPPASDPDPDPDPDPGCQPTDLGVVEVTDATAYFDHLDSSDPDSPEVRLLYGDIDPVVELTLGLWDGYGAFSESGAAIGDYAIAGDDAVPADCGLCLKLKVTAGGGRYLFATGGTVELHAIDGTLTGAGLELTFEEVDDDGTPIEGTCGAVVDTMTFDAPLEDL